MQVDGTAPRARRRVKHPAQREKSEMEYYGWASGPEPTRTAAPAESPGLWRVTAPILHRGIGAPTRLDYGGEKRSTATPGRRWRASDHRGQADQGPRVGGPVVQHRTRAMPISRSSRASLCPWAHGTEP